jgi:hypothetical protein
VTWSAGPAQSVTSALTADRWQPAACQAAGCTDAG